MGWLRRLIEAREGSIAVLGALSLVSVIGMSSLAVELGNGYAVKVERQRVADVAALGAALAYKATPTDAAADAAAKDVAQANGMARAAAIATVSPDKSKVTVTIQSSVPIELARVLTKQLAVPISNVAVVSLVTQSTPGCITALSSTPTYGVTLSGGVSIQADGCSVVTNAGVTVPSGTHIYAKEVAAGKSIDDATSAWTSNPTGIITNPTPHNIKANQGGTIVDPLGGDTRLDAAFSKLGQFTDPLPVTSPPALTPPTVSTGTDWTLNWSSGTAPTGVTVNNGVWTAPAGTYAIRSLTLGGGVSLVFQGTSTITISNGIGSVGAGIDFGNCTCSINGSVSNGYQTLKFGNGNIQFGGTVSLTAGASIGNGDVTFAGPLSLAGNISMGAGVHKFTSINLSNGTLTLGAGDLSVAGPLTLGSGTINVTGNGNTSIGRSASGVGLSLSGGAKLLLQDGDLSIAGSAELNGGGVTLTMGKGSVYIGRSDAGVGLSTGSGVTVKTGGGAYFSVVGPMNISQGSVTLGAADYRIGNSGSGNCAPASMPNANCTSIAFGNGNLVFGDGPFSANGNITVASNGSSNKLVFGATATHYINGSIMDQGPIVFGAGMYVVNGQISNTSNGAMTGDNVTFILKDSITLKGSAGFHLTAPTTDAGGGIADVVFATRSTDAAVIGAGSNNIMSGVFYTPNSALTLSGGASIGSNGACLMYVVSTITLSGGTTAATTCPDVGSGSAGSGSIALIK